MVATECVNRTRDGLESCLNDKERSETYENLIGGSLLAADAIATKSNVTHSIRQPAFPILRNII